MKEKSEQPALANVVKSGQPALANVVKSGQPALANVVKSGQPALANVVKSRKLIDNILCEWKKKQRNTVFYMFETQLAGLYTIVFIFSVICKLQVLNVLDIPPKAKTPLLI